MILRTLAVAGLATLIAAAPAQAKPKPVSPPPKSSWSKVDPSLFGMHVSTLSAGKDFPGKLGGVRVADDLGATGAEVIVVHEPGVGVLARRLRSRHQRRVGVEGGQAEARRLPQDGLLDLQILPCKLT